MQYVINDYFSADISLKYRTENERDSLRTIFDIQNSIVFVPFPTSTVWNSEIFDVLWIGDFNLIQRAFNNEGAGFNGTIKLKESGKTLSFSSFIVIFNLLLEDGDFILQENGDKILG